MKDNLKVFIICHLLLLKISQTVSITGGSSEDITKAPFLVQIFLGGVFKCAGTLLSNSLVLTAASCVDGIKPHYVTVKGGASTLMETGIQSNVFEIIVHEDYRSNKINMDTAILKLETPISGALIKPVRLGCTGWKPTDEVKIYGWGYTNTSIYANQLHTVGLYPVKRKICGKMYGYTLNITKAIFCASAVKKGSCTGDSGGAVIINDKMCGIIPGSTRCSHPNVPEIFMKMWSIRDFIDQVMRNNTA